MNKKYSPQGYQRRKDQFISLFIPDKTWKPRMSYLAELEGRKPNNFVVYYGIEGALEKIMEAKYEKLTPAQKKAYDALR